MNRWAKVVGTSVVLFLLLASGASAQEAAARPVTIFTNAIGVGLVVIGAAYGIGRLASAALDGMARQPEVVGNIQVAMIIAAALIEGFTFYAIFVCSSM